MELWLLQHTKIIIFYKSIKVIGGKVLRNHYMIQPSLSPNKKDFVTGAWHNNRIFLQLD